MTATPVVSTFNEWDSLEEIIVGVVEDALIPPWETITPAVLHDKTQWPFFKAEGVTVRRPERFAWGQMKTVKVTLRPNRVFARTWM